MNKPTIGRGDDWYVYTGEGGDAIAISANGVGPNGGWVGINIAKMAVPGANKSRQQINEAAAYIVKACNAYPKLRRELEEVLEWARVEKAPLRKLEIDSIRALLKESE